MCEKALNHCATANTEADTTMLLFRINLSISDSTTDLCLTMRTYIFIDRLSLRDSGPCCIFNAFFNRNRGATTFPSNCFPCLLDNLPGAQSFPERFEASCTGSSCALADCTLHLRSVACVACLRSILLSRGPPGNKARKVVPRLGFQTTR